MIYKYKDSENTVKQNSLADPIDRPKLDAAKISFYV